ncbi:MAG: hypothetical protein KF744_11045 [Taibaiella sp.]|nr:hypothetical protein [Taibaiella sp.]
MKKLLFVLLSVLMLGAGYANAQSKGAKMKAEKEVTKKQDAKAEPVKQTEETKLKKDGTPDMRYKENKAAKEQAKPAGPMKKDGTPDKRYKANK